MSIAPGAVWVYRSAVLIHIAGVVVWMGAVAYYLIVLRPAFRMAAIDRGARYALLIAVKARLRRVVGAAILAIITSGLYNAHVRGLLTPNGGADPFHQRVFRWKMGVVTILLLTFLCALPLLKRVRQPAIRGRLFLAVHVFVLTGGAIAAAAGVLLSH